MIISAKYDFAKNNICHDHDKNRIDYGLINFIRQYQHQLPNVHDANHNSHDNNVNQISFLLLKNKNKKLLNESAQC
jgi:hypothetical protein